MHEENSFMFDQIVLISELIAAELYDPGSTGLTVHEALEMALVCAQKGLLLAQALETAQHSRSRAEDALTVLREKYGEESHLNPEQSMMVDQILNHRKYK